MGGGLERAFFTFFGNRFGCLVCRFLRSILEYKTSRESPCLLQKNMIDDDAGWGARLEWS
jgi:hypothetical protein